MIKRVEVAERGSIVLALTGYVEALRIAPETLLPSHMSVPAEIARVTQLIDDMTNKFLYLSDKLIFDNALSDPGTLIPSITLPKEGKLIIPAHALQPGRRLRLTSRSACDICGAEDSPHASDCPNATRNLDSDISEDR